MVLTPTLTQRRVAGHGDEGEGVQDLRVRVLPVPRVGVQAQALQVDPPVSYNCQDMLINTRAH